MNYFHMAINAALLAMAAYALAHGFGSEIPRRFTIVPTGIAVVGAAAGFIPNRVGAATNAILGLSAAIVMWLFAGFRLVPIMLWIMSPHREQIDAAATDALALFVLGGLSLLSGSVALGRLAALFSPAGASPPDAPEPPE